MDIMVILQIIVLLGAIFVGVRLGGIGIGYAGGAGVLILGLCLGMKPGNIPWDVILIIASVISAISAMQLAGGLDYLVYIAEKILYKNPKYINYLPFSTPEQQDGGIEPPPVLSSRFFRFLNLP